MNSARSSAAYKLLLLTLCVLVSGCNGSLPTTASLSQIEVPSNFQHAYGTVSQTETGMSDWWSSWHDPALKSLIEKVYEANVDIRITQARLSQANSAHVIVDSFRHPTIGLGADLGGGAGHAQWPQLGILPTQTGSLSEHLEGIGGTLEPDIFGSKADDANAALQTAISVQHQLDDTLLIATAEAARNYIEARGLVRRLGSLDQSLEALRKLVEYTKSRYESGQAQSFDVATVESRLGTYKSKRPLMLSAIEERRRHAAILAGLPPSADVVPSSGKHLNPPAMPFEGIPSEVLDRRPDVRARAAAVEAQASRANSARKDLLPRFKISVMGGNGRLQLTGIPGFQGTGGLLDLSVHLPIFTAGRIQANIAANDARLLEVAGEYDKAVLKALEEVENAYTRRHAADQHMRDLNSSLISARKNKDIIQKMYVAGAKTLADVVSAEIDLYEREDDFFQAEVDKAVATLYLYTALGGAW